MGTDPQPLSVFGATGYIGSRFVEQVPGCISVPRDERVPPTDNILYLIGTTNNYHVFDDLQHDVDTNLRILLEVLEHCQDRDVTINFVSSWFVYGTVPLPATEDACCNPRGFYSITKKCAEDLLISWCRTFEKRFRILRLCNIYGEQDPGAGAKKNALHYLIDELKRNQPIGLYWGGNFVRDYLHVSDVVRAIELVVDSADYDSVFNIGSGIATNFREIIDLAADLLGSSSEVSEVEQPRFHNLVQVKDMYLDTAKLKRLGYHPHVPIEKGIAELCQL